MKRWCVALDANVLEASVGGSAVADEFAFMQELWLAACIALHLVARDNRAARKRKAYHVFKDKASAAWFQERQ
ncbi:hypothetical protein BRAS3843_2750021 [Bradyrhizobium sp. STM 3843]|nr:hypothetical protein BRAS3843_2750021 [Bradyrhizobium sp. STM 3843]